MKSLIRKIELFSKIVFLSKISIILLLGCANSDIKKDLIPTKNVVAEKAGIPEKAKENISLEGKSITGSESIIKKIEIPKEEEYLLGPDDVLFVSVWKYPELGTNVEVADKGGTRVQRDGSIYLPLIGEIKVSGLSLPMARGKITEAYSKYLKDPQVVVTIQQYGSRRYYVMGEVGKGGVYQVERKVKLLEALSMAGGITYRANLEKAYIIRGNTVLPIDFEKVLLGEDPTQNIELENNDFIYIPTLLDEKVYVLGEVKTPGIAPMPKGRLNLLSAIADRGDFSIFAVRTDIKVIRGPLSNPQIITVDLSNLEDPDKVQNIELASEDIVYVPQTKLGAWNEILTKITPSIRAIIDSLTPVILYKAFTGQ